MAAPLAMAGEVLIFGAGAVGCTAGGWLSQVAPGVTFLSRGATADALEQCGVTLYAGVAPAERERIPVRVARTLAEAPAPAVVVLTVKNYGLDAAARQLREALGDTPIVVGLQNGVENQQILPRYFPRVVYGIVHYNAWVESPAVVGYQKRGPLVFGIAPGGRAADLETVRALFAPALPTLATPRLGDAVHGKLIVNLANSLTTLVGFPQRPLEDRALFQKLVSRVAREGVDVVSAAGFRELRVPGTPSWFLIRAAASLPRFLTRRAFEANLRKMVMSSMAQDVLQRGGADTELDTINGRILELADRHGVAAPCNRALYALCRERFARQPFLPLGVREAWARIGATG